MFNEAPRFDEELISSFDSASIKEDDKDNSP